MEMLFFYLNISALVCSAASLIFGGVQLFLSKQGTYYKTALFGIGSITLAFLFCFVFAVSGGNSSGFSLGYFGMIGTFLFLLTANRSYISVLEDAETKYKKRARFLAFIMPAVLCAEFVLIFIKSGFVISVIPPFLLLISAGIASYFAFREVLLRDIKNGFIDCMRPFNSAVCLLAFCCMTTELFAVYESVLSYPAVWYIALCVISDIDLLLLSIFLHRGMKKWVT